MTSPFCLLSCCIIYGSEIVFIKKLSLQTKLIMLVKSPTSFICQGVSQCDVHLITMSESWKMEGIGFSHETCSVLRNCTLLLRRYFIFQTQGSQNIFETFQLVLANFHKKGASRSGNTATLCNLTPPPFSTKEVFKTFSIQLTFRQISKIC